MKLAKILVISLAGLSLWSCKQDKKSDNKSPTNTTATNQQTNTGMKIAYVNIDSMQEGLEYFQAKKKEFEGKERSIASEMDRYQREIQNAAIAFQNKIKSKNISEVEAEQTQRRIEQMQINAAKKQETLTANFIKQQAAFNEEFLAIIQAFIEEYNKEHNYDFILSQGQVRSVLYYKPQYNITQDVTAKMNEWIKNKENQSFINQKISESSADTTKTP